MVASMSDSVVVHHQHNVAGAATTTSSSTTTSSGLAVEQAQGHHHHHQQQQQLRPLTCELACLSNCDGSALWKSGGTHVLASVHGPIAPKHSHNEKSHTGQIKVIIKSSVSAATTTKSAYNSTYEREWEDLLVQVLSACCLVKQYPRCIISVIVQIVSSDGSVLVAALHAAVAALMDAGIEMRTLPTAACCALTSLSSRGVPRRTASRSNDHSSTSDGVDGDIDSSSRLLLRTSQIRLDPTSEEERMADAVLVFVLEDCNQDKLLACHSITSNMKQSMNTILQCCTMSARASQAIVAFWRIAIEAKVTRESQTLWSS